MRTSSLIACCAGTLAAVSLVSTGCGGPKFVPVAGTVMLDDKPLAFKSVLFTPEEGTPGNGAGGYTDAEGKYSLIAIVYGATEDRDGIRPGSYRVTVSEPVIPISESDFGPLQAPDEAPEAIFLDTAPPARSQDIPVIYRSAETTPLRFDVTESSRVLDVQLKSQSD